MPRSVKVKTICLMRMIAIPSTQFHENEEKIIASRRMIPPSGMPYHKTAHRVYRCQRLAT